MKTKHILSCTKAKQISIEEFLKTRGYKPEKDKTHEAWFCSPLRSENQASFKVCRHKNVWFDHGTGLGGTIIDLVMKLQNCTISEALLFLSDSSYSFSFHQQPKIDIKQNKYTIQKVGDLQSSKLLHYINSRKINIDFAKQFCREVHYSFDDQKTYSGVGFQNDLNGFEIRYFKFQCCLFKKSITSILNHSQTACFFESWSDFLSYLTLKNRIPKEDFIILNSTSLVKKTEHLLSNYKCLKVFFDNDAAGQSACNYIQNLAPKKAVDCSIHYSDYNDLNDYLIHSETIGR